MLVLSDVLVVPLMRFYEPNIFNFPLHHMPLLDGFVFDLSSSLHPHPPPSSYIKGVKRTESYRVPAEQWTVGMIQSYHWLVVGTASGVLMSRLRSEGITQITP